MYKRQPIVECVVTVEPKCEKLQTISGKDYEPWKWMTGEGAVHLQGMEYWRRCCIFTLQCRIKNEEIREIIMYVPVCMTQLMERHRLRWYEHAGRTDR